jgi:hypothetical protein
MRAYNQTLLNCQVARNHLIEAAFIVYKDSEKTGYYEKHSFKYYSVKTLEFVWEEKAFRDSFNKLREEKPELFVEISNFLINDTNTNIFDSLLALE